MQIFRTITDLRQHLHQRRRAGAPVGFVPTMGALHDGHLSLIERAGADDGEVVVSIFVNPLQFAPTEDLAAYPRDLERDCQLAQGAGATTVFAPSVEEMYPRWPLLTSVSVASISESMEGAVRPHHFSGVATVVGKLFSIVGPCRAFFREKDFQQLAVVRAMVEDLSMPVEVVGCPTVREPDGLAMSSRNVYLSDDERRAAAVIYRALTAAVAAVEQGERDPAVVRQLIREMIEPVAPLDYAEVVDARTLAPIDPLQGDLRLLVAARFGRARLIDNVGVQISPGAH